MGLCTVSILGVTSINSLVDHSAVDELGENKKIEGG